MAKSLNELRNKGVVKLILNEKKEVKGFELYDAVEDDYLIVDNDASAETVAKALDIYIANYTTTNRKEGLINTESPFYKPNSNDLQGYFILKMIVDFNQYFTTTKYRGIYLNSEEQREVLHTMGVCISEFMGYEEYNMFQPTMEQSIRKGVSLDKTFNFEQKQILKKYESKAYECAKNQGLIIKDTSRPPIGSSK